LTLGDDLTQAILSDWRTAAINEKLRAMLGFLNKLALSPNEVGLEDIAELRAASVTDQAITDAIYICAIFNIITRVADALGLKVPPAAVFKRCAKFLSKFGYKLLSGVWFERRGNSEEEENYTTRDNLIGDPYISSFQQMREAVLSAPGELDPAVRKAAIRREEIPGILGSYVKQVAERAWAVSDEDIAALREAGYTEDQIFEATVSAALGAGLARLRSGISALAANQATASLTFDPEAQ
jgi:alkylhydroperoxidase family enzyme